MENSTECLNEFIRYKIYRTTDNAKYCVDNFYDKSKHYDSLPKIFHKECFCVSEFIINFTNNFFDMSSPGTDCNCKLYGKNSECELQLCGYSLHEVFSNNNFNRNVIELKKSMVKVEIGEMENYKSSLILICMLFGNLSNDFKSSIMKNHKYGRIIENHYENIVEAYNCSEYLEDDKFKKSELILKKVYFFICFFLNGNTTIEYNKLLQLFKSIISEDSSLGIAIYNELNTVLNSLSTYSNELNVTSIFENFTIKEFRTENLDLYVLNVILMLKKLGDDMRIKNPAITNLCSNNGLIYNQYNKNIQEAITSNSPMSESPMNDFMTKMRKIAKNAPSYYNI